MSTGRNFVLKFVGKGNKKLVSDSDITKIITFIPDPPQEKLDDMGLIAYNRGINNGMGDTSRGRPPTTIYNVVDINKYNVFKMNQQTYDKINDTEKSTVYAISSELANVDEQTEKYMNSITDTLNNNKTIGGGKSKKSRRRPRRSHKKRIYSSRRRSSRRK